MILADSYIQLHLSVEPRTYHNTISSVFAENKYY